LRIVSGAVWRLAIAIALLSFLLQPAAIAAAPSDSPPSQLAQAAPPRAPAVPPPAAGPRAAPQAPVQTGGIVQEIRVDGTQRVDPDTVRSYLQVQPGEPYDAAKLDASLKALYATGLFSDVTMQRQGNVLVVHVVENPVINRVQFEGNSKITDENLNNEVQLRSRLVFTREKVQSDVTRIRR
jgi:outer membrane protein insertion porin family